MNHTWAMCMEGNIMSREAWRNRMGRRARCMSCGAILTGYEAAKAIIAQSAQHQLRDG
jgi:hypothetical protein